MTEPTNTQLILASGSPRRQEFLIRLGLPYTVQVANIDETPLASEAPAAIARRLAEQKAQAVAAQIPQANALIIAADTVVALGDESLGKPATPAEAEEMLIKLRNRAHQVITAVSVLHCASKTQRTRLNTTDVYMRDYQADEIAAYIATGDPFDKAGGYAIQHPQFAPVSRIAGCLSGVIGLPLGDLVGLLAEFGVSVSRNLATICQQQSSFACCSPHNG